MEADVGHAVRLEETRGIGRRSPILYSYRQTSDTQVEVIVSRGGEVLHILPMDFNQIRLLNFQLARALAQWPL